jgi:hypothetical protein
MKRRAKPEDLADALSQPVLPLAALKVVRQFYPDKNEFCFLNKAVRFTGSIEWDYHEAGLLWAYNLNYFEWLYDDALSATERMASINEFVAYRHSQRVAGKPYTISLRTIAWIRFLLRHDIREQTVLNRLYADADWLCRFPEYHLGGNHLLENALALLCAGVYFKKGPFYKKGASLLKRCLSEQVLPDGGHIEGSTMYHSLLLWRMMQCIELLRLIPLQEDGLEMLLTEKATRMLGWIQAMTFSDNTWPMFNDTAPDVAPATADLIAYAEVLHITPASTSLSESGYRLIRSGDFELAIDVAPVQPDNQPGHVHADIGTFCLHFAGRPIIVDTGISTYEASKCRMKERGTAAHNTIAVGGKNSSEIWKSFRIARRARVWAPEEREHSLGIRYSPYAFPKLIHRRTFSWNDNCIRVSDQLEGEATGKSTGILHFHPDVQLKVLGDTSFQAGELYIQLTGTAQVKTDIFQFAAGFNRSVPAQMIRFYVTDHLIIEITAKRFDQTNT